MILQLKEDELREAVILVFANKQDMPNAMTAAELTNALNLNNLRNRRVSIIYLLLNINLNSHLNSSRVNRIYQPPHATICNIPSCFSIKLNEILMCI